MIVRRSSRAITPARQNLAGEALIGALLLLIIP
jgi:hypothetical protein